MPLLKIIESGNNFKVGFWQMSETSDELVSRLVLTVDEKVIYKSISLEKRKREFLSTLILLQELFHERVSILKDEHGAPRIEGKSFSVSVTHSADMLAIITGPPQYFPGIDTEFISDRVQKIKHKFLHADELAFINKDISSEHLLLCWCAKEAVLKMYRKRDLDFINQIQILPFNPVTDKHIKVMLYSENKTSQISLETYKINNFLVVWGSTPCDEKNFLGN